MQTNSKETQRALELALLCLADGDIADAEREIKTVLRSITGEDNTERKSWVSSMPTLPMQ